MSIIERLERSIHEAHNARRPLATLSLSEMEARTLSKELADLKIMASDPPAYELFDSMVCGTAKFKGLPIKVTPPPPSGLAPGAINRVIAP